MDPGRSIGTQRLQLVQMQVAHHAASKLTTPLTTAKCPCSGLWKRLGTSNCRELDGSRAPVCPINPETILHVCWAMCLGVCEGL